MRLIGFRLAGERRIGVPVGDGVRDLGPAREFYADPRRSAAAPGGRVHPLGDVLIEPAVPETARVFCVGLNYADHAAEAADLVDTGDPARAAPPVIFGRWQQSLVTTGVPVPVPPREEGLDWEVELAVIIGGAIGPTSSAGPVDPLDHVLGYAAFNDLSARRKQLVTLQFTLGKNADRSGPISELVTADEVGDVSRGLRLVTRVNGIVMQDGDTRRMIHSIPDVIAFIADTVTLLPGDVIATGTPAGVGVGRNPAVFLHPGDVVEVEVERVGRVRNPIVAHGAD